MEADGTWVRMRDGSMAEVKAVVAYAGKEGGRRVEPVRLGCVGEAPGDFWEQAVAQMGSVNVNPSFTDSANAIAPIAPIHPRRFRRRQAPFPASRSGARSFVR